MGDAAVAAIVAGRHTPGCCGAAVDAHRCSHPASQLMIALLNPLNASNALCLPPWQRFSSVFQWDSTPDK